jgi:hypothetical protein
VFCTQAVSPGLIAQSAFDPHCRQAFGVLDVTQMGVGSAQCVLLLHGSHTLATQARFGAAQSVSVAH